MEAILGPNARISNLEMGHIQLPPDDADLRQTMGMRLRRAREGRGLLRKDAAAALRISECYLQGFEEDNLQLLPEPVYSIGFLRSYAYYLGLDPAPLLEELRESLGAEPVAAPVAKKVVSESQVPRLAVIWGGIACAVLLVLAAVWWGAPKPSAPPPVLPLETQNLVSVPEILEAEIQEVVSDPESSAETSAPAEIADAPQFPEASVPAVPRLVPLADFRVSNGESLEIRALARTWIEVRARGRVLVQRTLTPGEVRTVVGQPGMTFSTGNAAGVVLATPQVQTSPLGAPGQVLRGIALCPENTPSAPAASA